MAAKASHFKLGLFVIIATTLGVIALSLLGAGAVLRETVTFETYIDESVQGLETGAPVKIRGVKIGKVSRIDFASNKYRLLELSAEEQMQFAGLILVEFEVDRDFIRGRDVAAGGLDALTAEATDRGLRVRMASSGLTGPPYLAVDFMDPKAYPAPDLPWEPEATYIPSAPSTINQFVTAAENIITSIEGVDIGAIVTDFRALLADVEDAVNGLNTDDLSKGTQALLSELRQTNAALKKLAESEELSSTLEEAPAALADLRRLIRRTDTLVATQSDDLRTIIINLRQITDNLESISESAKDYPSQLLLGEPPPKEDP